VKTVDEFDHRNRRVRNLEALDGTPIRLDIHGLSG
jgi:hypothetical protein